MDDDARDRSALIIQKCFREYVRRKNKGNHVDEIKRKIDESSFVPLTDNKFADSEKVYEELERFYRDLSTNKSRRIYLATLLSDIDEDLSLLRNITSLDSCQIVELDDKWSASEEIRKKAEDKHKLLLNDVYSCFEKN